MFSLQELTVFLAAAEQSNFSKAARLLHLSQPAVSQTIDSLEKHFGAKLFMRQGRSVRLTEAGQVLQPMARELMASAQRIDESMFSLKGEVVGELNVGCSTAAGKYLLPGLIARFRRQFPRVRINVHVSSRCGVFDWLNAGQASLGISSKLIEMKDLEYQPFFTDEVILIANAGHSWARYGRVYPDDLLDEPMVLREEDAGTREVLLEGLLEHDIEPDMLKVSMVLGNAEAIVMAVEEGLGVAFVSRLSAARSLELGRVTEVQVEGMSLKRCIYLARNRRFPSTRAQYEFWNFVRTPQAELVQACTTSTLP